MAEDQSEIEHPPVSIASTPRLREIRASEPILSRRATTNHTSVLCACIFLTIDLSIVFSHLGKGGRDYFGRLTMKTIRELTVVSAIAFSAFALANISGSAAYAGPAVPAGHYCMTFDTGGSDRSFTSYDQCLATASGTDAECYGKTARDDSDDRNQRRRSNAGAPPR